MSEIVIVSTDGRGHYALTRAEADFLAGLGVPLLWGPQGHLYHAGASMPAEREERLYRWLVKNADALFWRHDG